MEKSHIAPNKITKPMQLLGAWLVGLLTIDSMFLITATNMNASSWQSAALTIAAIVNVPIFIGALFLLQTKFRPELQEDSFYSTYLNNRTNEPIKIPRNEALIFELDKRLETIERHFSSETKVNENASTLTSLTYGVNVHLENKKQVLSALNRHDILGVREFGQGSNPPEILKVAITESITKSGLNEILRLAQSLGFTHYGFIEYFEEIDEDVLFGAYGEKNLKLITDS